MTHLPSATLNLTCLSPRSSQEISYQVKFSSLANHVWSWGYSSLFFSPLRFCPNNWFLCLCLSHLSLPLHFLFPLWSGTYSTLSPGTGSRYSLTWSRCSGGGHAWGKQGQRGGTKRTRVEQVAVGGESEPGLQSTKTLVEGRRLQLACRDRTGRETINQRT